MTGVEKYVKTFLLPEYNAVLNGLLAKSNSGLSVAEITLIYKYTEDGYEHVNEVLRKTMGSEMTEFGRLLHKAINKLPDYENLVYRCCDLTESQLEKYTNAEANNSILVENSFISASKSKTIAYMFGRNCQFRIFSKSGKEIERFAKYGIDNPQNEQEILFKPNCKFKVIEITRQVKNTLITMEEVK